MKLKYKSSVFTKKILITMLTLICTNFIYAKESTPSITNLPMLLDLGAKKCFACKKMAPILVELENEYKGILNVKFIDVWQPENVSKAKEYNINAIPTQIFLDENEKELERHVGFMSKEDILNKWKSLGYNFTIEKAK